MKISLKGTPVYIVGFVLFILLFALLLLSYSRRVEGHSMVPTFEDGDLVLISNVPATDIHVGDIIVYSPPCSAVGNSVIHRVIQVSSQGFVTKGDNNPYDDRTSGIINPNAPNYGYVTPSCIEGKVVFVVPYVERLASLPYGLNYVLVALIFLLLLYTELQARNAKGRGQSGGSSTQGTSTAIQPVLPREGVRPTRNGGRQGRPLPRGRTELRWFW